MKVICFFSNKAGVGTTSLVYHLAWKMAEMRYRVLAADLDPQASLSAMFLEEEELARLFEPSAVASTIYHAVKPLSGADDVEMVTPRSVVEHLALLPGDIRLSMFEDPSSKSWAECLGDAIRPFDLITAFQRALAQGAAAARADVVLVDVGPNLGAINRAALLAADHVIVPIGVDVISIQGLPAMGSTLAAWREGWKQRRERFESVHPGASLDRSAGAMALAGYVTTQRSQYAGKPSRAREQWLARIPELYLRAMCRDETTAVPTLDQDRSCLARIKHYRSLMPMALEARKPIFRLTPADGAIGAHVYAARECGVQFRQLAEAIAARCEIQRSDDA